MKPLKKHSLSLFGILTGAIIVVAIALTARSQTAPVLTITALGTNQFSINFTNYPASTWDLQWTPVLNDPDFPWTFAAVGTSGQSNYVLNMEDYQSGFFRTILDTNSIPIWEEADPNNPGAGILTVFIDSPTNHSTLTQ
ncbi:MAG TPA: hypothetical protein VH280_16990 [Verrucomicrobiae bacterium]|jgi:hypothetical protein|nr:hypothetical protein [Verrucomicrobiae bacterium]